MSKVNKKYYWLKLQATFFDDLRIKKLRNISGGDTFTCIYLKLMLLSLKNDGYIEFEGVFDTVEDEISEKLGEKIENVKATLIFCENMKMLEISDQNNLHLNQVENLTGSETASAERKRNQRKRESQKLLNCDNVTPASQNVTQSKSKSIELEKELDSCSRQTTTTTITIPQEFEKYFNSKNFSTSVNFEDEYERFKLYNTDISRQTPLNFRRWVDNIKVSSASKTEKQDYSWEYKKLKANSEAIEDWIFQTTNQVAPTYHEFKSNPINGLDCVKLKHPHFDKDETIFYKQGGESETLIKQIGA